MKRISIFSLIATAVLCATAASLTPEQAIARLNLSNAGRSANNFVATPALTTLTSTGNPAAYIFNHADRVGYVVVAADDVAQPLLGYSDNYTFDEANMAPALRWWLEEYARQIEWVNNNLDTDASTSTTNNFTLSTRTDREAIQPMITTKWDQGEPYFNDCPYYGTDRTYTGCVATAMAQVMNYWEYPEKGTGTISYNAESIGKRLTLDFSRYTFDWDNMLDTYVSGKYNDTQAAAVAYLMKACGYSVKSDYAYDATGALAMNIRKALVKYFKYDGNADYQIRAYYPSEQWEDMIYTNLKECGPILYGGGSFLGGGHAFVCDGYDGNGYYHFNWGWSGISDGYFALDAISPATLGTGGGNGGGYNFTQDAVFGIQPPTGEEVVEEPVYITQGGSLAATVSEDNLVFSLTNEGSAMWINYNPETLNVLFGAIIEPQGATVGETQVMQVYDTAYSLEAGYGIGPDQVAPSFSLSEANLADGTYKITMATAIVDDSSTEELVWTPVRPLHSYSNSVILTKTGSNYTVTNTDVAQLTITQVEWSDNIYYGCLFKCTITVENNSDIELAKGFAPIMFYEIDGADYAFFLGESVFITVKPGESVTKTWTTDLNLLQQYQFSSDMELKFTFFDESTYNYYDSQFLELVTMKANPGEPTLQMLTQPSITNGTSAIETVGSSPASVYLIDDPMAIDVETSFKISGFTPFIYNTMVCVIEPDWNSTGSQSVEILASSTTPILLETPFQTANIATTISYPTAKPNTYYSIMLAYVYGGYIYSLSHNPCIFRLSDAAGIDNITVEESEDNAPIYNLQGVCLGTSLDELPAGLYIRNGKKVIKK